MNIKDFFDTYSLKARLAPSVFVIAIFSTLYVKYVRSSVLIGSDLYSILFESLIGICLIFIFSAMIRSIGKFVIEKIMFDGKLNMPTTKLLLGKKMKNISRSRKDKILQFLIDDLQFDVEERKELLKDEPNELKKEIQEIIATLRNRTRGDEMLLRANQSYGLWRNLSGALCLAVILLFVLYISNQFYFLIPNSVLLICIVVCFVLLIISLWLTRKDAYEYAEVFFTSIIECK